MAVSPNTTNIAVSIEVAEKLRGLAKKTGMTALQVTNQLLISALSHNITLEKTQIHIKPDDIVPEKIRHRKK